MKLKIRLFLRKRANSELVTADIITDVPMKESNLNEMLENSDNDLVGE